MASIPTLIRYRFRAVGSTSIGPRNTNLPGVAVLVAGPAGDVQPPRILEVVAAGSDVYAVAADLVAGHLKGHPGAYVHAQAALIPDAGERERAVRELAALCPGGGYSRRAS